MEGQEDSGGRDSIYVMCFVIHCLCRLEIRDSIMIELEFEIPIFHYDIML